MVNKKYIKEEINNLYRSIHGCLPKDVIDLPGAGSDRKYFRIIGKNESIIAVFGNDVKENQAFCNLSEYFISKDINVPKIYAISDDYQIYLQEDLGGTQLFDLLKTERGEQLVEQCMRQLPYLQLQPKDEWSHLCFNKPFSLRQVMWDLNYFKYEYLKPAGIVFNEDKLEDEFEIFARQLIEIPASLIGFMYRDCQSRNIMVHNDSPYWIDFQGGRVGPCLYDAVSFLWQAKASFSNSFRKKMLSVYADEYANLRGISVEEILSRISRFVTFRTLQVLGAYGFRGLIEHKAHFIESIPGALSNLRELIKQEELKNFPELQRICEILVGDKRFTNLENDGRLRVEVISFSYKKGYPKNYSSNGGGFMFDCRGLHNPGRYDEYKPLTGLDKPVRDFLEAKGEIQPWLRAAWELTDQAVATYLRRGFTSLQIGFGCTGGRHRSVYSADATARHIAQKFPDAIVIVNHREQNIQEKI